MCRNFFQFVLKEFHQTYLVTGLFSAFPMTVLPESKDEGEENGQEGNESVRYEARIYFNQSVPSLRVNLQKNVILSLSAISFISRISSRFDGTCYGQLRRNGPTSCGIN